jgi:hypothetical protein
VWGGILGLVFVLPFFNNRLITKGALISFFPTLVQLLAVFPLKAGKSYFGMDLGMYNPKEKVLLSSDTLWQNDLPVITIRIEGAGLCFPFRNPWNRSNL